MAAGQQFNLRWNNHTNNILQVFLEQLSCEHLVDVTLSCQGQFIKAHKMVLSACSPYFQDIFRQHQHQHPVIIINGMKFMDIKLVVEFMYKGEIKVLETELDGLLAAAEALQVKGLSNVRNKYEKGDIQCADAPQVPTSPNPVQQDKSESLETQDASKPLILRRKRRRLSDSAASENSATGEANCSSGEMNTTPKSESAGSEKDSSLLRVECVEEDDLPSTIKVEPPDIRDIDEEEASGWESPKLVIDLPEVAEHTKNKSRNEFKALSRVTKSPKGGATSDYGKSRNLDYGQQTASTSRQSSVLSALQERNSEIQSKRNVKIPRPPNAFMIFANEWRRKLAFDHPSESNKDISVRLGMMWKNLSYDTKESYYSASRAADEEHKRKYPGYYYSPKEARLRKSLKHDLAMARKSPKSVEAVHLVKVLMSNDNSETNPYLLMGGAQANKKDLRKRTIRTKLGATLNDRSPTTKDETINMDTNENEMEPQEESEISEEGKHPIIKEETK